MPGYKSPINVETIEAWNCNEEFAKQIAKEYDDNIVADVSYALNVDIDKHELVKALEYDREQYYKGYADRDAEIIRCKDCLFYNDLDSYCGAHGRLSYGDLYDDYEFYFYADADDYCSYAVRKDEEE